MAKSLMTTALKGLRWTFENSILPLNLSSRDEATFFATKVWTPGSWISNQAANSRTAIATTIVQNILRAFFTIYKYTKLL